MTTWDELRERRRAAWAADVRERDDDAAARQLRELEGTDLQLTLDLELRDFVRAGWNR